MRFATSAALMLSAVIVSGPFGGQVTASSATASRVAGSDRYATAVETAALIGNGSLTGLDRIIVVTGERFPDALTASGLAGALDRCPSGTGFCGRTAILMTRIDSLPDATATAIAASRLPAANIIVVGGPSAVSAAVHAQIAQAAGWSGTGNNPVTRIAGQTRYETATAITAYAKQRNLSTNSSYRTVLIANGENFPDALAAGSLAYRNGHLLLLSPPPTTPAATRTGITGLTANCAILVGGTAAISNAVASQVTAQLASGGCGIDRINGQNRYETAANIASRFVALNGRPTSAILTSGTDFADALVAAPLARNNIPLLLTNPRDLSVATRNWLAVNRSTLNNLLILGGPNTIPDATTNQAINATAPTNTDNNTGDGNGGDESGGDETVEYEEEDEAGTPFVFKISIPEGNDAERTFIMLLSYFGGALDVKIDWGVTEANATCQTSVTTSAEGFLSCIYPPGSYTVTISANPENEEGPWLYQFGPYQSTGWGSKFITEVVSFGNLGITELGRSLEGSSVTKVPNKLPSSVTDVSAMFNGATLFNQDLSGWDTKNVRFMHGMFENATLFNGKIGNWNTENVETMYDMFNGATSFNQNISGWDTNKVENMGRMFNGATSFNQDLSGWCVTLIAAIQGGFDTGASSWTLPRPVWGTCPS